MSLKRSHDRYAVSGGALAQIACRTKVLYEGDLSVIRPGGPVA